MSAPALAIAIPLVLGVATGILRGLPPHWAAVVSAIALAAAVTAFSFCRPRSFTAAVVLGAFCAGSAIGTQAQRSADHTPLLEWATAPSRSDAPAHLRGVLRDDAAAGKQGVSLTVDVNEASANGMRTQAAGGVRASIAGALAAARAPAWRQGRTIEFDALLRVPLDYRDPGVPSDRERLARQRIALLASVKSAALVTIAARGSALDEAASAVRALVRHAVTDAVGCWSLRSAGVVTAILIGDRSSLDPEDERRLQEAGTYHVIAISGGNIALLTMLLIAGGRAAGFAPRGVAAGAILVLAFYGYAAGLAPSVLRATLAGSLYLAGRAIDRQGPALNALAVAAVWAAAAEPLTIVDPGFILSFGATLGIVTAASRLMPADRRTRDGSRPKRVAAWILRAALELGVATVCAEVALAPVAARLFGRVSVAGLVLNFAAIPLMSIIQVAGMAAVALWPVSIAAARAAGWVSHGATTALVWSAGLVDVAPWLVVDVPPPAIWVIAAWYAGCAVALTGRGRLRMAGALASVAAGALLIAAPVVERGSTIPPPPPGWSRVVFLDVGQGDAALLWPAGSDPVLVDAGGVPGGGFDVGRRVTVPALWALGGSRLSAVLLSHADPDHIGGVPAVLRAFIPREVLDGIPVPTHVPLQQLHAQAAATGIKWRAIHTGDGFDAGVARIRVLNPPIPDWVRPRVRNDDSVVLEARFGDVVLVLPGDISAAVEPSLVPLLSRAPLTIVKAPHHGSAGSSSPAFIAALRPAAVIFSAGRRNPFGHPAAQVVDRYRAAGAEIFRTDVDGAVFVDTDGHDVRIHGFAGGHEWTRR